MVNVRVLRLHNGPNLELFEYLVDDQRPAARPSDFGLQHIAIYVEDIDASATAIERCGGTLLQGPGDMVHAEAGPANRWRYVLTPWGMTIEIVAYTHMEYEKSMSKRRWTPPPDAAVVA